MKIKVYATQNHLKENHWIPYLLLFLVFWTVSCESLLTTEVYWSLVIWGSLSLVPTRARTTCMMLLWPGLGSSLTLCSNQWLDPHTWYFPGISRGWKGGKKGCLCLYLHIYIYIYVYIQRRQWQPTPVLLPGKSHRWRSLVGCSPWGR